MNRREVGLREFARATDGRGPVATGVVREASPVLSEGVERFIFADTFSRSGLGARERELITVAVLAAIGGADNQLGVHVPAALQCGADAEELLQLCEQIAPYCGFPRALNALRAVRAVLADRGLPLPDPVREVALTDHTTLVTDRGEGPAVDVFLHAPELDRRAWRDLIGRLPEARRAVAPDLRGAGAAVGAPPATGLEVLVDDVVGVMDALEVERARVVSLGTAARLAVAVAARAPDRVRGVVLVAPSPPVTTMPSPAELAHLMLPVTLARDCWAARYARDRYARLDPEGWTALTAALGGPPPGPCPVPVRVLLGDQDAPAEADACATRWGAAAPEIVPETAQLVPLESPIDLAAALG